MPKLNLSSIAYQVATYIRGLMVLVFMISIGFFPKIYCLDVIMLFNDIVEDGDYFV